MIEDGGILGETGILPQWRLSVPKPGFERGGCNNWEIRDAPQDIFREHKKNWYQSMLLTGKLDRHLLEVEKMADERLDILMKGLLQSHPAADKEANQLAWAAHMNGLMAMAEEIVLLELVYS